MTHMVVMAGTGAVVVMAAVVVMGGPVGQGVKGKMAEMGAMGDPIKTVLTEQMVAQVDPAGMGATEGQVEMVAMQQREAMGQTQHPLN